MGYVALLVITGTTTWVPRLQLHSHEIQPLQWHHNERDGISNHRPHYCLLNCLFSRRSKKTSKLCVTGLCEGNSPVTGEFPTQRVSNAENVSIWWHHHVYVACFGVPNMLSHSLCTSITQSCLFSICIHSKPQARYSAIVICMHIHIKDWFDNIQLILHFSLYRFYIHVMAYL